MMMVIPVMETLYDPISQTLKSNLIKYYILLLFVLRKEKRNLEILTQKRDVWDLFGSYFGDKILLLVKCYCAIFFLSRSWRGEPVFLLTICLHWKKKKRNQAVSCGRESEWTSHYFTMKTETVLLVHNSFVTFAFRPLLSSPKIIYKSLIFHINEIALIPPY